MKNISALLAALLILKTTSAEVHEVTVSDFQFSPANVNVAIGDTVKWTWVSGFHTTTSKDIPNGTDAWDKQINPNATSFIYKVTKEGVYNYVCTFHESLGMVGTITASATMPVVLTSFNIGATNMNKALITWITATEENTDRFEIMRSTDGTHFENIATVAAKGNSSITSHYSYTDEMLPNNYRYVYYSLSIVDKDGKKYLSDIAMFRNVNGVPKLIVQLSPNPISRPGHLMLQFNSDKANSMHVQLYDAAGKLVKEANMTAVAGLNNGHFHIGDVPPGTYTIIFSMNDQKESYKIVVQ